MSEQEIPRSALNQNAAIRRMTQYAEASMEDLVRYSQGAQSEKRAHAIIGAHRLSCAENPRLANCDPVSHFQFLALGMSLDLVPGKAGNGMLYAVPFGSNVTPIIGYKGYSRLWHRAHPNHEIVAALVEEGDAFEYDSARNCVLRHDRANVFADVDITKVIGAYVSIIESGSRNVVACSGPIGIGKLYDRARKSQSYKASLEQRNPEHPHKWFTPGTPWHDWHEKMLLKTAVKMLLSSERVNLEEARDLHMALAVEAATEDEQGVHYSKVAGIKTPDRPVPDLEDEDVVDVESGPAPVPEGDGSVPQPSGEQAVYGEEDWPV